MSIPATNWVWSLTDLPNATTKLVLLKHADHAHDDGTHTWQSVATVAKFALCSNRTAQRANTWLLENGYMREGDQSVIPDTYPHYKRPIAYELAMDEATRQRWAAEYANGGSAGRRDSDAANGAKGQAARKTAPGVNLSPDLTSANTKTTTPGVNLSPGGPGDIEAPDPVTPVTRPGDTGVTQTTQEPSLGTTQTPASPLRDDEGDQTSDAPAPGASADAKPKIVLTEEELENGRDEAGNPLRGERLTALAQAVTAAWWDWVKAHPTYELPTTSYLAARGIVRTALGNGIHPKDVKRGLAAVTADSQPVTTAILGMKIRESRGRGPRARGYDDRAVWGERPQTPQAEPDLGYTDADIDRLFGTGGPADQDGAAGERAS